jgi:hypothetical protein
MEVHTRLVINYQKVNNMSRKDAYPLMPRIDDLLNNIGPARWLSVADAWSGYSCKCHCRRTPLQNQPLSPLTGCGNTPECPLVSRLHQQRTIMQTMLTDLIAPREASAKPQAAVFLDDCLMWAQTVDEHLVFESQRSRPFTVQSAPFIYNALLPLLYANKQC